MKRLITVLAVCFLSLAVIFPLQAQSAQSIAYGQTVTFEISKLSYEIPYQFTGKKNDVIVSDMQPTELQERSIIPVLRLLNSKNEVLADTTTTTSIAFYGAKLAFELPADGTYTLVATRANGATGTDEGDFSLYLGQATELMVNQTVTDKLSTGSHNNYYFVRQTSQPLTLTYHKMDGGAAPDVAVNKFAAGSLQSLIELRGQSLTQGQVALPTDITPIVISVGGTTFSLGISQMDLSYELTVS